MSLYYEKSGSGTETLVLLHGFMENHQIWKDIEPLLEKNFTLLKIDLPGHGKSQKIAEIHTMDIMADAVKKVLDEENIQSFHLLGHSMGGYVSLAFADKFPELLKSITLFFSSYLPDTEERKVLRKKSFRIIRESMNTYVSAGVPLLFNKNEVQKLEDKIQIAKSIALSTHPEGAIAALEGMILRPNRLPVIEKFERKVLFILGKHDNAIDSIEIIQSLPNKPNIKTYLLDCGHNGHWEKPEICATIINTELEIL